MKEYQHFATSDELRDEGFKHWYLPTSQKRKQTDMSFLMKNMLLPISWSYPYTTTQKYKP